MHHTTSLSSSLTMAKGNRGYLSLLPQLSSLSLPPRRRPCLPSQPRCNVCRCHGLCLRRYRCRLPHFVDCCLPPQFLLLSATTIATVASAATPETVSAAFAIAVRPHFRRHCPCRPCTCPLRRQPASSPSPSPTSSPSPSLARHPRQHRCCLRRHHPLRCTALLSPSLLPPSPSPSLSRATLIVITITLTTLALFVAALNIRRTLSSFVVAGRLGPVVGDALLSATAHL